MSTEAPSPAAPAATPPQTDAQGLPIVIDVAAPGAKPPGHVSPFEFNMNMRSLGSGSFSEVQLVERHVDHKLYALKTVNKQKAQQKNVVKYVVNERRVLSLLNHPFIIKLLWTSRDEANVYFFYEHAPRGELWELLQKLPNKTVPVDLARHWLAQLVSALEHIHGLGIAHRDVKPENILLADDFSLRLCDFGTAKVIADAPRDAARKKLALEAATKRVNAAEDKKQADAAARAAQSGTGAAAGVSGPTVAPELGPGESVMSDAEHRRRSIAYSVSRLDSFTGTPEYMAPEVVDNKPSRGITSDLWSLGIVAYQLLTGLLPFRGDSAYLTFRATLKGKIAFPAALPTSARELLSGLLRPDPAERWTLQQVKDSAFFADVDWAAVPTAALSQAHKELLEKVAAQPLPQAAKKGRAPAPTVTMEDLEREFGPSVEVEDGFIVPGQQSETVPEGNEEEDDDEEPTGPAIEEVDGEEDGDKGVSLSVSRVSVPASTEPDVPDARESDTHSTTPAAKEDEA